MNWLDLCILAIIAVSVVISIWRGFIKEAFSLVGWLAAVWFGWLFADDLQTLLVSFIGPPLPRTIVAFIIIAVSTLILSGVGSYMFSRMVEFAGLDSADKVVAVFFGVFRGYLVAVVILFIAGQFGASQADWWQDAALVALFEDVVLWMAELLPADVAANIKF